MRFQKIFKLALGASATILFFSASAIQPAFAQEISTVERKVLDEIDRVELRRQEELRLQRADRPRPVQFAVQEPVFFTLGNSGVWSDTENGSTWRLEIVAPGAVSVNIALRNVELPQGARLTVSDPDGELVQGPYTAENISAERRLFTAMVNGAEVVVELFVPRGEDASMEIFQVNKGFIPFSDSSGFKSGSCNNDVVCPVGAPWQNQIRSVVRYTIDGAYVCTGTLVNNTDLDFTPYVLSADHCNVSSANDDSLVFYWNYQSPNCGDLGGGSLADNQTGAIFRAANGQSDFLLVELSAVPNVASNVFYSGWDRTGGAASSTVGIHHPSGDEKAISFNTNAVTSTLYGGSAVNNAAHYWRVDQWEDGTTEPGSSGSCLWDANSGLCVGTLTGGSASCTASDQSDWYGKFSSSWTGGGTNATRLSNWLDPGNTGQLTLNGDPHLRTLDGVHYDFQGAGEFVALKDESGAEVQVRQSPISTSFVPGPDSYHGLQTCVSLNTAVAARIGEHRVSYQPRRTDEGRTDPRSLDLRVDGRLVRLGRKPINLDGGGRIVPTDDAGGLAIVFPEKYVLTVTPNYWNSQDAWYLNVGVVRRPVGSTGGLSPSETPLGVGGLNAGIAAGSWLPPLPDGSSVGGMPADLGDRFDVLYGKFGGAWRVTDQSSLFDYAPGETTASFTDLNWPRPGSDASCPVAGVDPVREPTDPRIAERLCREVADGDERENCIFDVMVMGDEQVPQTYVRSTTLVGKLVAEAAVLAPPAGIDGGLPKGPPAPGTAVADLPDIFGPLGGIGQTGGLPPAVPFAKCMMASSSGSFACQDAGAYPGTCAIASCPQGYTLTGGGGACSAGDRRIKSLAPRFQSGEYAIMCEQQGVAPDAYAICCKF